MKTERNKPYRRRFYMGISTIVLLLVMTAAVKYGIDSAYAWLSGSNSADNVLQLPQFSVMAEESNDGTTFSGWTNPGIDWMNPVPKYTRFTNTGQTAMVLRVGYSEYWTKTLDDGQGGTTLQYLSNSFNGQPAATPNWTANGFGNTTLWYNGGDGWYYYRHVLAPGESTEVVLQSVSFLEAASTAYAGAAYALSFNVEGVQYSTNPLNENQQAVWETFLKTYSESAGVLTWSSLAP